MKAEIIRRRHHFAEKMLTNSIAIFFSAPEQTRSNDTHYPYRQNSNFWYLTLFNEPESALVLIKNKSEQVTTILFNRQKDVMAEVWTGYRLGQAQAITQLAIDQAFIFDEIAQKLPELVAGKQAIYHADQQYQYADNIIQQVISVVRKSSKYNYQAPDMMIDWRPALHEMRLFKSATEIVMMKQAGKISALGHIDAMKSCRAGLFEYQLEAVILHTFAMHGARWPAYNSIVGSGNNACILHYENNSAQLKDGDLVLIDAGCEYENYAGDISRTFPVNGKFSPAQREIYDLVLSVQYYAIENLVAGNTIKAVNEQVIKIMVKGLIKLGILQGDVDQLIEEKAYLQFYMHGLGHWLGLDVHDVGNGPIPSRERVLEPGMVLTVEPGLYIDKEANVPSQYRGIGIRIEDNILITSQGNQILTQDVPKDPDEIEALMIKK
ncbi:Xaa-Pro aminopeptidase [Utexia brackfieldae]|uniref:Xaa-Pro aminopeptidase n=1 Tax=Utexia brackfieldae TaxID=3074108 RepID=UPI00370D9FBC